MRCGVRFRSLLSLSLLLSPRPPPRALLLPLLPLLLWLCYLSSSAVASSLLPPLSSQLFRKLWAVQATLPGVVLAQCSARALWSPVAFLHRHAPFAQAKNLQPKVRRCGAGRGAQRVPGAGCRVYR